MRRISEARVLIVATDGFEEWELFGPRQILQERGADVVLASLKLDPIQATVHDDPGKTIKPDLSYVQMVIALVGTSTSRTTPTTWRGKISCRGCASTA